MKGFYQYIADNLTYPVEARRKGTEGKVFVKFVVTKDGSIEAVRFVKGIGDGCDAAAIEVIKESADWTPGENRGEKVNVMMILPITFALESRKEKKKRLKNKS